MKQGIQTNFPHEDLREYGCYFFALLRWAEIITRQDYDEKTIMRFFDHFRLMGWIEDDCFIVNPVSILNYCVRQQIYRTVSKNSGQPYGETFIVYLKKPGHGHFVLSHKGEIWDSLDPGRPGVGDYKVDSYRVIV